MTKKYSRIIRSLVSVLIFGVGFITAGSVWATSASTTVSTLLSPVISISSNGTVNDNVNPSGVGAQSIQSDSVSVSTNDSSGYTLQLAETAASSALVSGGNSIAATSGTWASPATMSANTWGYRVDGAGSFSGGTTTAQSSTAISGSISFAAVPATASPQTIKTTSGTAANDGTTVWYGVAANTTQPSGTYTNSVTYTAIAN